MPLLESHEIETVESRSRNPFPDDGEVAIAGQNFTKEEAVQDARNERNIPFDRGWAWVIVLGSFIVNFLVIGTIVASSGILMAEFQAEYEASSSQVMGAIGLSYTLRNLLAPVAGMLAIRISIRKTVMLGGLLICIGFILSIFPTEFFYLYFTFGVLVGIGSSFSFIPTLAMIGQYFRKRSGLANGLGVCGCGAGLFASAPLARYLVDYYGSLSSTLLILGGIMLNICLAGSLFRPVTFYTRSRHVEKQSKSLRLKVSVSDETNMDVCTTTERGKSRKGLLFCGYTSCRKCPTLLDLTLFKSALFLVYSVSIGLIYPGFQVYIVMISDHAKRIGVPVQQAAFLVSIVGITDVVGRILLGFLADLNVVQKRFLFTGCTTLGGAAVCLVSCLSDNTGFAVIAAVFGLSSGGFYALLPVIMAEKFGIERFVSSVSIIGFIMGFSVLIATLVTGALKDITGDWSISFIFVGLLMLVGSALVFLDPIVTKYEEKKHNKPLPAVDNGL